MHDYNITDEKYNTNAVFLVYHFLSSLVLAAS